MDVTLFITILTVGAALTALLTEAIKTWYKNDGKSCSPNIIAMINAFVVGGGGCAVVYMLLGIEWSINNIICLVLTIFAEWLVSMVGYDKVAQLIKQVASSMPVTKTEDEVKVEDTKSEAEIKTEE